MGFGITRPQDNDESTQPYEAAYGELAHGSLIGLEATLANLRRVGVIFYLIFLLFITDQNSIVGSRGSFLYFIALLIAVQAIFWWLERSYPSYKSHRFRVIRFLYYLFSSAIVFLIGKGSDAFIPLFLPYLILGGVYVGTAWGIIGSIVATILIYWVYLALSLLGISNITDSQIVTRMVAIFLSGAMPTYFWFRYIRYRESVVEFENKLLEIAAELTSTLEFDLVLQQAFKLLGNLVKFQTGLIVADFDNDEDYSVIASWNYPNSPDLHFNITTGKKETLTGEVLKTKKSLLVSDVETYQEIKTKFPEISPGKKLRSYLGVPLLFGQEVFGVFMITSDQPSAFSGKDRENMEWFSRWLSIAIKNGVAHNQLNELGRYHQEIIDLSDEGIIVTDPSGQVVLHNIAARKLLELTSEEVLQRKAKSIYAGGAVEARRVIGEIQAGSGIVRDLKSELLTGSGKTVPVLLSGSILKDPGGHQNSVGYFRDLRKLPLPEQRLKVLLEVSTLSLRYPTKDMREQVQRIIDIFDKDADGKYFGVIRLIEDNKLHMFVGSPGLDLTELQGFSVGRGEGITGQVLTQGEPEFVANVQEDPRFSYPHFALAHNLHSGLFMPLKYGDMSMGTFAIYTIGDGDFPASDREFYINFSKQASLVLTTLELTQAYLRQRALSLTAKVATGSAYSMKRPLTSIRGWTQLLQFENNLKKTIEENQFSGVVANIDLATRDLERLIDELIRATEDLVIRFESVDLYAIVKDVVQNPIIQKVASEENVEIHLEGVPSLINGDRRLLFDALINVIQNALDAQPTGGEINIKLIHSPSGEAHILILDRGPGISLKDFEDTADIFLPFSSTKTAARRQYFGLSLAYTQKVIEAHGGTISARNIPSSGTEIEIVMTPTEVSKSR